MYNGEQRLDDTGKLTRQGISGDNPESRKPFVHTLLGQGRLEQFILDSIHQNSSIRVERGVLAERLSFDEAYQDDQSAYPITVQLRTIDPGKLPDGHAHAANDRAGLQNGVAENHSPCESNGTSPEEGHHPSNIEVVKARYLIACDGARSWTRDQMGIPMEGSSTDHIWYVSLSQPISSI